IGTPFTQRGRKISPTFESQVCAIGQSLLFDMDVEPGGDRCAVLSRLRDADQVVARLRELMLRLSVAVRSMSVGITIGSNLDRRTTVAEVPRLSDGLGKECPDFERNRIAGMNVQSGCVTGVDRRGELAVALPVNHEHNREIVVDVSFGIDHLEDFAVFAWLLVPAFSASLRVRPAVGEGPVIAVDRAVRTPRTRSVERRRLPSPD